MTENKTYFRLRSVDIALAYLFLRLLIGVNYFNHGFTRIGNIPGFAEGIVEQLQASYFPEPLVRINAFLVPIVELVVGILITLGLATRVALSVTLGLMVILMMGVTSVQNWDAAGTMLVYGIVLFILLAGAGFNIFSIDYFLRNKRDKRDITESGDRSERSPANLFSTFWIKRKRKRSPSAF
jgi:thiosulfate dehydrogenase (quinone) large subunit